MSVTITETQKELVAGKLAHVIHAVGSSPQQDQDKYRSWRTTAPMQRGGLGIASCRLASSLGLLIAIYRGIVESRARGPSACVILVFCLTLSPLSWLLSLFSLSLFVFLLFLISLLLILVFAIIFRNYFAIVSYHFAG